MNLNNNNTKNNDNEKVSNCPFQKFKYTPNVTPNLNINLPVPKNGQSNSPWDATRSGHSSTSPPGTTSSCSSANSHTFGSPPSHLDMDSLFNSLLEVSTHDTYGSNGDVRNSPTSHFNIPRCASNCTDPTCTSCRLIRQSRPGSSSFLDHFATVPRGSLDMTAASPSPPMLDTASACSMSPCSIPQQYICDIHQDAQPLWCQTCNQPFCGKCSMANHHGHMTVFLLEALENAGAMANQVINEARVGINVLRDDLNSVQLSAEMLEHKSRQAISDLMICVRRVVAALESREKELLGRIEKARQTKYASLKARDEGLRGCISRLSKIDEQLTGAMEAAMVSGNPMDLLLTKDMASAEVYQVRQSRQNLPPPEEHWISFSGLEGPALHSIANLGSIMETNPGLIGDRRSNRGRGNSPQNSIYNGQTQPRSCIPRGRAIASTTFPVVAKIPRHVNPPLPGAITVIGHYGEGGDNLCRPWGVCCDQDGHIIVADRSNNRIRIFLEDGSLVREFGSYGTGHGQFDRPAGITVDCRKRIIVADKDNHRIQILTMEGVFLSTFGEKGSRCGQFHYPWDVATNTECQIVVSDTRNHRVQLFSAEGIFLRKYGYETTPSMWKHFDSPRGVAFNPEGNVVTTDFNNHRVVVIDADFQSAKALGCEANNGVKQFLRPQGVCVDDDGNILVGDSRNHRIQMFNSSGKVIWRYGDQAKSKTELDRPSGIAILPNGRIVVVDFGNNRVLVI